MASNSTTSMAKTLTTSASKHMRAVLPRQAPTRAVPVTSTLRPTPFTVNSSGLSASARTPRSAVAVAAVPPATESIDALIFDCDGVIVESEDIHRRAYNAAFAEFDLRCPDGPDAPVVWSVEFYDVLQNTVGGGKPKMRWYFNKHGWPTSSILGGRTPANEADEHLLIDTLQDFKTDKYKEIIGSGQVSPRPGVIELMDAAKAAGVPVAVCSAATKAATDFVLPSLLGKDRFGGLDLYMAGDDVPLKKPDPTIYRVAAERLKADPARCLVVEDSIVGLTAAVGAGMRCIITYTSSTADQEFKGAAAVLESLDGVALEPLAAGLMDGQDDRVKETAKAAAA